MKSIREEIKGLMCIETQADDNNTCYGATLTLPAEFVGFKGHFEGRPILPGVGLIEAVLAAAEHITGNSLQVSDVKTAKFFTPVTPAMRIEITLTVDRAGSGYDIGADIASGELKVSKIRCMAASI